MSQRSELTKNNEPKANNIKEQTTEESKLVHYVTGKETVNVETEVAEVQPRDNIFVFCVYGQRCLYLQYGVRCICGKPIKGPENKNI